MSMSIANTPTPTARSKYYVSLHNGCIYQAMTSPAGYEDQNPKDYRPANPDEVERYLAGESAVVLQALPIDIRAPAPAQPNTIKLADEDEPAAVAVAPPVPPAFTPPAPALGIPAAPAPFVPPQSE